MTKKTEKQEIEVVIKEEAPDNTGDILFNTVKVIDVPIEGVKSAAANAMYNSLKDTSKIGNCLKFTAINAHWSTGGVLISIALNSKKEGAYKATIKAVSSAGATLIFAMGITGFVTSILGFSGITITALPFGVSVAIGMAAGMLATSVIDYIDKHDEEWKAKMKEKMESQNAINVPLDIRAIVDYLNSSKEATHISDSIYLKYVTEKSSDSFNPDKIQNVSDIKPHKKSKKGKKNKQTSNETTPETIEGEGQNIENSETNETKNGALKGHAIYNEGEENFHEETDKPPIIIPDEERKENKENTITEEEKNEIKIDGIPYKPRFTMGELIDYANEITTFNASDLANLLPLPAAKETQRLLPQRPKIKEEQEEKQEEEKYYTLTRYGQIVIKTKDEEEYLETIGRMLAEDIKDAVQNRSAI